MTQDQLNDIICCVNFGMPAKAKSLLAALDMFVQQNNRMRNDLLRLQDQAAKAAENAPQESEPVVIHEQPKKGKK